MQKCGPRPRFEENEGTGDPSSPSPGIDCILDLAPPNVVQCIWYNRQKVNKPIDGLRVKCEWKRDAGNVSTPSSHRRDTAAAAAAVGLHSRIFTCLLDDPVVFVLSSNYNCSITRKRLDRAYFQLPTMFSVLFLKKCPCWWSELAEAISKLIGNQKSAGFAYSFIHSFYLLNKD